MESKGFELQGAKEVMAALSELPTKLQASILRNFIRKAGKKFIVDELKATLNYSQKLEDSIKVVNDPKDKLAVAAGVTSRGYLLRWLDLGTEQRQTKKGYNRGRITGKKQIQPLIESKVDDIVKYTEEELGNEINKMLERRLRKLRKR